MKLYLHTLAESIQFEDIKQEWINFDLSKFSTEKTLLIWWV